MTMVVGSWSWHHFAQLLRQKTIAKFALIALFIKLVVFHEYTTYIAQDIYEPNNNFNEALEYREDWTPELGERLGLTQKDYRIRRRQYSWKREQQIRSVDNLSSDKQQVGDDLGSVNINNHGGEESNIIDGLGYYNLSCPFEWHKYSCASIQTNIVDEKVTAASVQYYLQHSSEIRRIFESVFIDQHQPKRIFMTGDSLLRQLFISIACNAFSLGAVRQSVVQWRDEWPCPGGLKKCAIMGGQHSGFDAASIIFTNGMELHFVPHGGFAFKDNSKGEPDVLLRMKWQIDNLGKIGFGRKTALPPSGPMDVFCYNVGAHSVLIDSRKELNFFASEIATPLMKSERRPKIVYVMTPTSHFNTDDGQYIRFDVMDAEKRKCIDRVAYNPRAELEKRMLKPGVNVDAMLDYDDLKLGALHIQKGDCLHYCMPGVVDLVAARLLELFEAAPRA